LLSFQKFRKQLAAHGLKDTHIGAFEYSFVVSEFYGVSVNGVPVACTPSSAFYCVSVVLQAIMDSTLPFEAVLLKLAYVVFFLRYWNRYNAYKKLAASNRVTPQTCLHIELTVHSVFNLLALWKKKSWSTQPPILRNIVSHHDYHLPSFWAHVIVDNHLLLLVYLPFSYFLFLLYATGFRRM
jgi:hypothetical protein